MSICLVCNNPLVKLLDLYHSSFAFNYCGGCFHCQMEKIEGTEDTESTKGTEDTTEKIENTEQINSFINPTSLVVSESHLKIEGDNILLGDFLDIDFQSKYKTIIFYKTFDKTREIKSFLKLSKSLLETSNNSQIIIVTSTENVISDRKYTSLNPNIISYFCTNSMKTLCEQFGLAIKSIQKNEDNSIYTLYYKKREEIGCSNDVILQLYSEIENDLYDDKTYILFNLYGLYLRANVKKELSRLNIQRMENLERDGPHYIVGWGGETGLVLNHSINLINFCELSSDYIDYFISFESESDTLVGCCDIKFQNYWKLLSSESLNSRVTIVNFTNTRINDNIYNLFTTLYGCDVKIKSITFN